MEETTTAYRIHVNEREADIRITLKIERQVVRIGDGDSGPGPMAQSRIGDVDVQLRYISVRILNSVKFIFSLHYIRT
jgi:hypothetical protein